MKKILFLLLSAILIIGACSKSGDDANPPAQETVSQTPSPTPTPTPKPTPTPEPTPDLTGLALNPLTGIYIDEEVAARRPIALVINNLGKALPQSGISQADIMYEVLAEGGITRMIGIFKDFDAEKIGPVRSTRHYFLDFALDNDAVFAHHGGSPQGYNAISSLKINNLDGMQLDGKTFFRDQARKNTPGMYEHSSYTSAERLLKEIAEKSYRQELSEYYVNPFQFYGEKEKITGDKVEKIYVPYSPQSQVGEFHYQPESNTYLRYQNGRQHIDELTGEQLSVSNVIVQYVNMYVISGDDAGRREVSLIAEGTGTLFTGGVSMPIKWSKASHQAPTVWMDENGAPLKLTVGKTWICVLSDKTDIVVEESIQ